MTQETGGVRLSAGNHDACVRSFSLKDIQVDAFPLPEADPAHKRQLPDVEGTVCDWLTVHSPEPLPIPTSGFS